MGQIVIDRGPTVDFPILIGDTPIPNIGVTVGAAGGIVRLRGSATLANNSGFAETFFLSIAKNGVKVAASERTCGMDTGRRYVMTVEDVDSAAVIGDVYTLVCRDSAGGAGNIVPAGLAGLEVEARQLVTTLTVT